jgi:hypothetical protein
MTPNRDTFPKFIVVGFVGARNLESPDKIEKLAVRERKLAERLGTILDGLQAQMGPNESLVVLSALAEGADTVFAEVAAERNLPHRIFLPTTADAFFRVEDFGSAESLGRSQALYRGANVIENRVASRSDDRHTRFSECGFEIANGSDLLIAAHDLAAPERAGGTKETLKFAGALGKPTIEINLGADLALPEGLEKVMAKAVEPHSNQVDLNQFLKPGDLSSADPATHLPAVAALKRRTSDASQRAKLRFHYTATLVVVAHLSATLVAAVALAYAHPRLQVPLILLKVALLFVGLGLPVYLFFIAPQRRWATARMTAELCRSVLSLRGFPGPLDYLGTLHLPELQDLKAALQVMHLRASREKPMAVKAFAAEYARARMDPQIQFYESSAAGAKRARNRFEFLFYLSSVLALADAVLYLGHYLHWYTLGAGFESAARIGPIAFPMLAAASASLISTLDLNRRVERFQSMAEFLRNEQECLAACESHFASGSIIFLESIIDRVEHALLQEVVEWYSKHTYVTGG